MAPSSRPKTQRKPKQATASATTKLADLAVAAPQVITHRLTRMAVAGPVLSSRDQQEFQGMVQEKQLAFYQSWMAMANETARQQQSLLTAWLSPQRLFTLPTPIAGAQVMAELQTAAMKVADQGLTPIHRKAVSNAKRLRKTKIVGG